MESHVCISARTVSGEGRNLQVGDLSFHSMSRTGGRADGVVRHILNVPARLRGGGGAEIVEMIGRARNACGFGGGIVPRKQIVHPVAAFGAFDEGEGDAIGLGGAPVNVALIFGNVCAMHRVGVRLAAVIGAGSVSVKRCGFTWMSPRS